MFNYKYKVMDRALVQLSTLANARNGTNVGLEIIAATSHRQQRRDKDSTVDIESKQRTTTQ